MLSDDVYLIDSIDFDNGRSSADMGNAWERIKAAVAKIDAQNATIDRVADSLSCLCDKWGDYSEAGRQSIIVHGCQELRNLGTH